MTLRAIRAASALCALALAFSGCGWLRSVPRRLGLAEDDAPRDPKTGKKRRTPPPSSFPPSLVEAFPDVRGVRVDPSSPRLSLAAESVLTRDDPHLRRGPPRFSPDGRLLAYEEADTEGDLRRLVIRRLDGLEIRSVPRTRTGVAFIAPKAAMGTVAADWPPNPMTWAPSSDAFAYTRQTDLGAWEVMIADLASEAVRIAGPPAVDGTLAWSPAGDRIAYVPATRPEEIWAAEPRGKVARPLFAAKHRIQSFAWSSDGKRIVFAAGDETCDLWILDLDASTGAPLGDPVHLVRWPFDDRSPSFSPDGGWVAFYSSFLPGGAITPYASQSWSLMAVRADGSDPPSGTVLMDRVYATGVSIGSSMPPAWAPDGAWVASVQPRTQDYHAIVLIEIEGTERHELAPDSLTNEDVAVSVDGVLAYRSRSEWGDHEVLGLVARGARRVEK